jgi:SAM-dependent methyltransferase
VADRRTSPNVTSRRGSLTWRSRLAVAIGLGVIGGIAWAARQERARVHRASAGLRTFSAPSARLYERLGWFIGGLYERFAADIAAMAADLPAPLVLEIGPGPGEVAVRLARRLPAMRLVGLDIDPAMVERATVRASRAGVTDRVMFLVGDVGAMPFEDGTFDLVVSSFSAHHWPDGAAGFAEIRRVLRPGARAVVYDLPDGWGHLETRASGLADVALAGGFPAARADVVQWPGRLAFVRRVVVARDDPPHPDDDPVPRAYQEVAG